MAILPPELLLPRKTVSGADAICQLTALAAEFGTRGIVVHGRALESSGALCAITGSTAAAVALYRHTGAEPTVGEVDALRAEIRRWRAEWVAAVGGGSVIDLAKAAAALSAHPETTAFYQLNPGAIQSATLPLVVAPTTAGTGSEATVVSVLTNPERRLKLSIRHPSHMPAVVILDPCLLKGCPPATIAASGMDAFVQAFESYTSRYAVPFTRSLAECAIEKIAGSLTALFDNPSDIDAAAQMLEASYITGLAFSHSRLGVIHGLAHPLGIRFQAAHGVACACCLPAALEFNRECIRPQLAALKARLGVDIEALTGDWMTRLAIHNPFSGGTIEDMDTFIGEVLASGSTAANPRELSAEDARRLTERILA